MKNKSVPPSTIEAVVQQGLCILCGTCSSACPHGVISFPFESGYRLHLDHSRCTSCSACVSVCPGLATVRPKMINRKNKDNYYIGEYGNIFSVCSSDFKQRFAGSSGGTVTRIVADLLAEKIVSGAILTRFSKDSIFKPEGYIATNAEDVLDAQGSKYSPVPLNSLLGQLDLSKKYAYVGLPCHLQGLDMYLHQLPKNPKNNFFKIGLFCSRTNTLQATKELLRLNNINEAEVACIRYRGSGHPGHFSITLKDGRQQRIPHLDPTYWKILFKRYFVQYRCWLCPDKTALYADISCGDDWSRGLREDRVGSSVVICRSAWAQQYFAGLVARGKLNASPMEPNTLIRSQGLSRKMNVRDRVRIAAFFKLPLPQFPGYEFKKERLPLRHELAMLVRIRLQRKKIMRWVLAGDLFFSPRTQALRNFLSYKRFIYFIRRIFPDKFRLLLRFLKKTGRFLLTFLQRSRRRASAEASAASRSASVASGCRWRIVTCGGYGYQDIGDEAMPKALIANLKIGFPEGLAVTMLSPHPGYTRSYHGHPAIHDIKFLSQKEDVSGLNEEMERYLRWTQEYVKGRYRLFFKLFVAGRIEFYRILKVISNCDALINVGGGNMNSIMRHELLKKGTLHRIGHALGKPVFISGQTIGPFDNDNDRSLARESLELASVLTFRDHRISADRVAELGVKGPLMYDAGDDALSLSCISKVEAQKLIAADVGEEWCRLKASSVWGINLKGSMKVFKGRGRSGDLTNEVNLMARVCEYLLKQHQAKVLLVSTDFCPGVDDRPLMLQLSQQIDPSQRRRVAVLENLYNDHQLKGITSFCDFVLGSRYHFLVFALAESIPAIGMASGLYQQTKLRGILELLDLGEYFVPMDMEHASTNDVVPFIEQIVKNQETIREKLRQTIPPLTAKSKEIVAHARSLLCAQK